jgi:hypothetical protein
MAGVSPEGEEENNVPISSERYQYGWSPWIGQRSDSLRQALSYR